MWVDDPVCRMLWNCIYFPTEILYCIVKPREWVLDTRLRVRLGFFLCAVVVLLMGGVQIRFTSYLLLLMN